MNQPMRRFLDQNHQLLSLRQHVDTLLGLQQVLSTVLPPPLRHSCSVANLKGDKVILFAEHSAAANKLRQMSQTLTQRFIEKGFAVSSIHVRVRLLNHDLAAQSIPDARPARHIGENGVNALSRFAETLPDDNPLRASLEQLLARRAR